MNCAQARRLRITCRNIREISKVIFRPCNKILFKFQFFIDEVIKYGLAIKIHSLSFSIFYFLVFH